MSHTIENCRDLDKNSEKLFLRAQAVLPGGVNSPVRACRNVGVNPRFIREGHGSRIIDADGKEYIDYIGSWGPMILGHNDPRILDSVREAASRGLSFGAPTEAEVELAELICAQVPGVEMIRMVNSGTEAVMSAIRTARGFTGREKIIKFSGCYHGHSDCLLVQAGSGVMTQGIPDSAGVPEGCTRDTLSAVYNDLDSVEQLLMQNRNQVAAVIVEPVAANMGVVIPKEGFLQGLRKLCDREGCLLIFDEVITGFRLGFTGAQGYFGVQADLVTYGKIIGAGMPVGAYGGRREIMSQVAPLGPVYQAGTLSGNPVAMAAGLCQLKILLEHPEIYDRLEEKGQQLFGGMKGVLQELHREYQCNYIGSLGCLFFTDQPVRNQEEAKASDSRAFARYYRSMLSQGIYMAPSQFEAIFLSDAHDVNDIKMTLERFRVALQS